MSKTRTVNLLPKRYVRQLGRDLVWNHGAAEILQYGSEYMTEGTLIKIEGKLYNASDRVAKDILTDAIRRANQIRKLLFEE